jgi:hypothetical protein
MLHEEHSHAYLASAGTVARTACALELGCDRQWCFGRLEADVACPDVAHAQLLLSHAASFDALRLQQLIIDPAAEDEEHEHELALSECDVATLAAVMEAHPSMWALHLTHVSLSAGALAALAAAAAAQRLTCLTLRACRFPDEGSGACAGAALARLLAGGCLMQLDVCGCGLGDAALRLLREAAAAGPCAATLCDEE